MSNPPLHLQPVSSNAPGARYSFLNTPAEYQAPTFLPRNSNPSNTTDRRPAQSDPASSPEHQGLRQLAYSTDATKALPPAQPALSQPPNDPPLNTVPPPLSEHPAQYAPYADSPITPPGQQQVQYPRYQSPPPPSPGPLPPKQPEGPRTQPPRQQTTYTVAPDSNPLVSPHRTFTAPHNSLSRSQSQLGTRTTQHDLSHAPGQVTHPRQDVRGGTWTHGLCDCRDPGICCMGIWCPCILYGRTQYRLSRRSEKKDPTNLLGYEACNASCTAMALLCGCQWIMATVQHVRTRRAYGIPGDVATDCVRASCCTCCTLIQDEREIKHREEAARLGGGVPGTTVTGYSAPGQMMFDPPPR